MDAIIILGAAVWADGPSPTLKRRTLHAASLWKAGVAPLIVPCGGVGEHTPSEAQAMTDILVAEGVPPGVILQEDTSTNTLDNIRLALPLLAQHQAKDVVLVTDAYHTRRAAMVARHFGLNVKVSFPAGGPFFLRARFRELLAIPAYARKLRKLPR